MNASGSERSSRIVSLVPSLTHMLCDFGLRSSLVGVTKFCIEPPGLARTSSLVGGTKDPDLQAIEALRPTSIFVNVEENKPQHIERCREMAQTFVCFPRSPGEVPSMLREAGSWLGLSDVGEKYAASLEAALKGLKEAVSRGTLARRRYLYLIWREPYMLAGRDTYIESMLQLLGWENAAPAGDRYPSVSVEEMQKLDADLLLLSSEPYPFRRRDAERLREQWPEAPQMLKVDGQLCSWYGTMTQTAAEELGAWTRGEPSELFKDI